VLVQQGKIVYCGSSNFAGWHIAQAQEAARRRHFFGLVAEQSLYNLAARQVELEVLPACQAYGLGVIPWSPLAGGLLGGALAKVAAGRRAGTEMQQRIVQQHDKLQRYEALCKELGAGPAVVALAWLLQQPAVTAPIIGPRTLARLDESLPALTLPLPAATLKTLDEIWPGPGGPAPEAYAW